MNKILFAIIALAAAVTGALLFTKLSAPKMPEHSLYYETPRAVQTFEMTAHSGESFTEQNLADKWSWVFFGYTSCPDVCPTTLQELNFNYDALKAIAPNTQVILASVDPKRDQVEKLAQYIAYFNDEFIAVRAGHDVLFPFARNLGLMYAITEDTNQENYLVDHSASVVLINPQGKIAAIFKPKHELGQLPIINGEEVVSDFAKIVELSKS